MYSTRKCDSEGGKLTNCGIEGAWPVGNAIAIIIRNCRLPSVKHFITTDFQAYRKSQFISSSALQLLSNNLSLVIACLDNQRLSKYFVKS